FFHFSASYRVKEEYRTWLSDRNSRPLRPLKPCYMRAWTRSVGLRLLPQEYPPMNKQNNCPCVVCNVEAALLDSFSTQTARNHFQALASNYPDLSHFSSPVDLLAHLHEQGGTANHNAGSETLHAMIHAIMERPFEEIGQQLLLLAFTPAIHK